MFVSLLFCYRVHVPARERENSPLGDGHATIPSFLVSSEILDKHVHVPGLTFKSLGLGINCRLAMWNLVLQPPRRVHALTVDTERGENISQQHVITLQSFLFQTKGAVI